jgi:16S rRNA (cytosine1402-N4)-methyltransferase
MTMHRDETYHTTVLLHEGVDALNVKSGGVYVDATLGAAGHTNYLLSQLDATGKVFGFDQDKDAVQNAPKDPRFTLCQSNFQFLLRFMKAYKVDQVDGVLADLGVSGHHFDAPERGFSFRFDAPLDMRMNQSQELSAKDVLNNYEEHDLKTLFKRYGESSFAGKLARKLVEYRNIQEIERTGELVRLVEQCVPERKVKGELAKIFQAIRIEVNQELEVLRQLLEDATKVLKPGGRLVVLSYHSLEDRMVKHFFRSGNFDDRAEKDIYGNVNRPLDPEGKVITPSEEEIERNPRARSAKMRIAEKR